MLRKVILLVSGSQVLMDFSKKILERAGYTVRSALGVAGAREQLLDFIPDGIVLENGLPDGNGMEFCRELRNRLKAPIMFTSDSKDDELAALQAGASDFLKKPFDYNVYKARIDVLLNTRINPSPETYYSELFDSGGETEPEAETSPEEPIKGKKRKPIYKYAQMIAAAFIIAALILIGVYLVLRSDPELTDIPEGGIPLGEFPFADEETAPG